MSDPALIRAPVIEATARALFASEMPDSDWRVFPGLHDKFHACARAVLATVTPLIRDATLEEAAQVTEDDVLTLVNKHRVAAAIRALKEKP